MNNKHVPLFVAMSLAGSLLLGGCSRKSDQQAANSGAATQAQPAQTNPPAANNPPAPPADQQTGAANPPAGNPPPAQQPPPPAARLTIPAGTRLRVRLDEDLGSKISQPGQTFHATLADPVAVDGQAVIPREARVEGTVIDARALGHFKGGALLELRLERVRTAWGSYPVATSTMAQVEKGKGKRTGLFAGGGGAFGAIVGGLAGGGKGALIGGLAGAGAGTAGSAMTGNKEIFLPAETLLTFRLERPVHVTEGAR
ncbi:MAG TPA: hypothetical protein VHX37_04260 [Acidobacteriaceae bacterium]|jgi:hypothetical protein|nr:hypothetical protein [Acidobacteriaceae bacterium]